MPFRSFTPPPVLSAHPKSTLRRPTVPPVDVWNVNFSNAKTPLLVDLSPYLTSNKHSSWLP